MTSANAGLRDDSDRQIMRRRGSIQGIRVHA